MSDRDRAAEVIRTWQARHKTEMDTNPDWAAQNLAGDLAAAGLLTPDIPEPNFLTEYETEWDTLNGYVHEGDGLITIAHSEINEDTTPEQRERLRVDAGQIIITDPAEAEYLGHLIIAAADHAQQGEPK